MPAPQAIREQLERVLASEAFATAGRHSRLLRYLVERTLAGEGDQLKEYVLGTEVFDRQDSYDPRLDSIVRVEARRLRARLDDYYRTAGARDPIVISIPRGNYTPSFAGRDETSAVRGGVAGVADLDRDATGEPPHAAPPQSSWTRSIVIFALALGVLVLVVIAAGWFTAPPSPTAQASRGPAVAVLPFQHYSTSEQDAVLAARITDAVTTELARLGTVAVASRTSTAHYTGEMRPVREIAKTLNVDFVLEATALMTAGTLHVTTRIVDASLDRKVWVGEYTLTPAEIATVSQRIAREAADGTLRYRAKQP